MPNLARKALRIGLAGALLMPAAAFPATGCELIPKIWLEDQLDGGMRRLSVMAELPQGCSGQYRIASERQQNGNRGATVQSGRLPHDRQGVVTLGSQSIDDSPGSGLTVDIELLFDDGMVIRQTVSRPGR